MSDAFVISQIENGLGCLTLNRPKALHSLDHEMCQLMVDALESWRDDDAVNAIWIDHMPETRGFCAGGDIRLLSESGQTDGVAGRAFFHLEYQLNHMLHSYQAQCGKAVIAIMDGITMGGGVGICVHGAYRVATENTVFAMPETAIGLLPDVGGGWFLPRLGGELGVWLAITGARLKTADTLKVGVATHYADSGKIAALKQDIQTALAEGTDIEDVLSQDRGTPGDVKTLTADNLAEVDSLFAGDGAEDMVARLEASSSEFAAEQLRNWKTKSPLTIKLALRQIREGANLSRFAENMAMEYRLATRAIVNAEFHEGVRAVIMDKDNAPKWQHETVADVDDALIDSYFEHLPASEEWTPHR